MLKYFLNFVVGTVKSYFLFHFISYHIMYFPHITFIYYKNIQIYCVNIFLILNNKIHIGFRNEEGVAATMALSSIRQQGSANSRLKYIKSV